MPNPSAKTPLLSDAHSLGTDDDIEAPAPLSDPSPAEESKDESSGPSTQSPENLNPKLSDTQIILKLDEMKTSLRSMPTMVESIDGPGSSYANNRLTLWMGITGGLGVLLLAAGGIPLIYLWTVPDSKAEQSTLISAGIATGLGGLSLIANTILCCSGKCRAWSMGKINRPITFDIEAFNNLLSQANIDPFKPQQPSVSTKDINPIIQKIEKALSQIDEKKQLQMGKEVMRALENYSFFVGRDRIILDYLISDQQILDRLAPHPHPPQPKVWGNNIMRK